MISYINKSFVSFGLLVSACFLISACGGGSDNGGVTTPVTLTVNASAGSGGAISPSSRKVQTGQTTSFTVTPNVGFAIASVTGCNGSLNGNSYNTGVITSDCSVSASFGFTYMLTAIATEGGRITPGSLSVLDGQKAQFSVVPAPNYKIAEVTGCGGSLAGEIYTTESIKNACTVNARFAFLSIGSLNDTGIDWCANSMTKNMNCAASPYFNGQDGEFGRDAQVRAGTLTKIGGGAAGFDYTKIAADGSELPIQDVVWDADGSETAGSQWSCVRDNVTGNIWEIKSNDHRDLRDMNHIYSWYNPDSITNGGNAGTGSSSEAQCNGSGCNTYAFVQAVNSYRLCGFSDWRLPTLMELMSIVHNGREYPTIDLTYFPNTPARWYWSSYPSATHPSSAWFVHFYDGYVSYYDKSYYGHVRLVRSDH